MSSVISFQTISQLFRNLSEHYANTDKVAFAFKPATNVPYTQITWDYFTDDVNTLAAFLLDEGIEKGDRVAILSENRYEWAVIDMAIHSVGAVNVALYATLPHDQCAYILQNSGAKLFFVSTGIQQKKAIQVFDDCPDLKKVIAFDEPKNPKYLENSFLFLYDQIKETSRAKYKKLKDTIDERRQAVTQDDLATLIYTSGTTGKPKGAMLSQRNICSNVHAALDRIEITEDDRLLSFLPLCHAFERTAGYYAVISAGAEIYYAESVDTVAKNLTEAKPTIVVSVPRLFERIYNLILKSLDEGTDIKKKIFNWALEVGEKYWKGKRGFTAVQKQLADKLVFNKLKERTGGRVKFFVSGGAALSPDVAKFFFSAGLPIAEGYGLTETAPVISCNPLGAERLGTVGHVFPGVTVGIQALGNGEIIAKLNGDDYPSDLDSEPGEIICHGPNVMMGYWQNEEATDEVIDPEGWFHSGDVGRFEDGYLKITDRIKHMIVNAGGKNIYPGPIEDMFKTSMWVDQIVLLGENQSYISALIVPDFEYLESYAKNEDIDYNGIEDLLQKEEIQAIYNKEIRSYSKQLASHEKVRKFRLLPDEFTVESGELTPTLKVKRRIIEQKYDNLIEEIYADDRN